MNKTKIIICLSGILLFMSILFACGVGLSTSDSLMEEELEAYNNRVEYTELTTASQKAAYAVGMGRMSVSKFLDSKNFDYLAPYYCMVSNRDKIYYYWGQTIIPLSPFVLRNWGLESDIKLDEEAFMAGYTQTMEKKVLIPELSGIKGQQYVNNIVVKQIPHEEITEIVDTVVVEEVGIE